MPSIEILERCRSVTTNQSSRISSHGGIFVSPTVFHLMWRLQSTPLSPRPCITQYMIREVRFNVHSPHAAARVAKLRHGPVSNQLRGTDSIVRERMRGGRVLDQKYHLRCLGSLGQHRSLFRIALRAKIDDTQHTTVFTDQHLLM